MSTSLAVEMVALQAAKRQQLQTAHEHAAEFHEAIAEAMQVEADLAEFKEMGLTAETDWDVARLEKRYPEALGRAAVALQKMPSKWAAILSVELDAIKPKSNVEPIARVKALSSGVVQ